MPASLKAIRKRISSVKSTLKITKAMKMVAGARLNRAQQRIVSLRPYAIKTQEILQSVADSLRQSGEGDVQSGGGHDLHPLLAERPEKNVLFLLMTADRGLCGGFNTNVSKATFQAWQAKISESEASVRFATAGRKGREYLQRRGGEIVQDFPRMYDGLDLDKSRTVSSWLVSRFHKGEFDAVYIAYNEFKSPITQKPTIEKLLPLPKPPAIDDDKARETAKSELLFEPTPKALLERLVPMYVEISIFRALLETQAGFFGAQMTAMDSATRNAKDAIDRFTLLYNRARQAAITKELMEIIGGAEALKE
ncbi:MAG: ATP synthase F1 subunit gamma [Polyangiaceae bacterium]